MCPTPNLTHDFPTQPVFSSVQSEAYWHLTDAYRYLCAHLSPSAALSETLANLDARSLLLNARDAVLSDSRMYHDGTTIDSLTGLVEKAERR